MVTREAWQHNGDVIRQSSDETDNELDWDDTESENPRSTKHRPRIIISPEDTKRVAWDFIIMSFILYESVSIPYRLCFKQDSAGFLAGLETTMDIFFMVDVPLNFITGVYVGGNLVMNVKGIAPVYLKTWQSLVDLLVIYPKFRRKYDKLRQDVLSGDVRGLCLQCVHCGQMGHLSDMCPVFTNVANVAEAFQRAGSGTLIPAKGKVFRAGSSSSSGSQQPAEAAAGRGFKSRIQQAVTKSEGKRVKGLWPSEEDVEIAVPAQSEPEPARASEMEDEASISGVGIMTRMDTLKSGTPPPPSRGHEPHMLSQLEQVASKHPDNPAKWLDELRRVMGRKSTSNPLVEGIISMIGRHRSIKGFSEAKRASRSTENDLLVNLFTHAQRKVASEIAHRDRTHDNNSRYSARAAAAAAAGPRMGQGNGTPSTRGVRDTFPGPPSSSRSQHVAEGTQYHSQQLPPLPTAPYRAPPLSGRGGGRVPTLDLAKAGPLASVLPLASSASQSGRALPTGGTMTRSSRRLYQRKIGTTSGSHPSSSTATRDRSTRANTPSTQRASLVIHGIGGQQDGRVAEVPIVPSARDPRTELKEEAQLVGELAFLGDLSCLAKLHHQRELFAEVDQELANTNCQPSTSSSGPRSVRASLTSARITPEMRRPSEWAEVRRVLLSLLRRVPSDKLPVPFLWDMLLPGLETIPIPLLMDRDPTTSIRDAGQCQCIRRAEPCLCLSSDEWREAWRGLRRHRAKARDHLSESSVANPFADPLLRTVCSGISERLHRVEKLRDGSKEGSFMHVPEGVEECLLLLGEYIRRAVLPGPCAAQALSAIITTLTEVKELLKAFHVEVRIHNEAVRSDRVRTGSLDSLSPMRSMQTPRPGDLYRWRRLSIAFAWTISALLECSDAVMAEGILDTLLDIPVASSPSSSPSLSDTVSLYSLLTPVIAASFFPESVEDSGMWVHPEVEDRRMALDRLRLLTMVTSVLTIINKAIKSRRDSLTVYVPMASRVSAAWSSIADCAAPVVMGPWLASIFSCGTGVIPRFMASRTWPSPPRGRPFSPEALLEMKISEVEAALFSVPPPLNQFLKDPHVAWYLHRHYSRFIRLYRRRSHGTMTPAPSSSSGSPSSTSSFASSTQPCDLQWDEGKGEDALAVAHLKVLIALARARSPSARKKFYSLKVVDFLCGEIDLEHVASHMLERYLTARGFIEIRLFQETSSIITNSDNSYSEVADQEIQSEQQLSTLEATAPPILVPPRGCCRSVMIPGLSFAGLAPSTQGSTGLLGTVPSEEATRDATSAVPGGPIPPPMAIPPPPPPPTSFLECKGSTRRSSEDALPPPITYPTGGMEPGDATHEHDTSPSSSSSSSSGGGGEEQQQQHQMLRMNASPSIVPRLAFHGLPPSVQGTSGLGVDPTPPEYVEGGQQQGQPAVPDQPWEVPPVPGEGQAFEAYHEELEYSGISRLSADLFCDCGRRCRRLYRTEELQECVLRLLLLLLLSASRGTLDCRYCDQFPALNHKLNVLFILDTHLAHPKNSEVLRRLYRDEGIRGASSHGGLFRLLKLLAPGCFPRWIYTDMTVLGGGAFGTVYRCDTVLDAESVDTEQRGRNEVVAVKLVKKHPSIRDRCVLFDVFNEIACLEEGRFDNYMTEIFDYGYDGCSYWIVMRCYHMTLTTWRAKLMGNMDDNLMLLLETYQKVLAAVAKLHRDGLVHYDLKCDNIMVLESGGGPAWRPVRGGGPAVVLADFGESRVLEGPEYTDLCIRNRGTEFVKPPEMLTIERALRRDDAAFDRRRSVGTTTASDIWSVGCLLYELLTGHYLFYNDDWIRFFMRLTGGGGRGDAGPSPAAAGRSPAAASLAAPDILTEENVEMLHHKKALCDFIRFMLIRDPQCRPTIATALHRFHRLYIEAQLERGIRPRTWRGHQRRLHHHQSPSMDPRTLPIPGEANVGLNTSILSSARDDDAPLALPATSQQFTPGSASCGTARHCLPDSIVEAPAADGEPRLSMVLEDTMLLTVPPGCSSVPEWVVREAVPTHVIDVRAPNEPNLAGFSTTVNCVRVSWGHVAGDGGRRSTTAFLSNIPLLLDFARATAASRGRLLLVDTGHVAMAFMALIVSEGHRLGVYRSFCLLLSRHLDPLDQPFPRLILSLAKWQHNRLMAWAHHETLLAHGCMAGGCLCGVCSWILRGSAVRSIVPFRGIIHDDVPTIMTCRCSPSEPVKACANLYSCAAYCQHLRSLEGEPPDPKDAAVWLWLPATLTREGDVRHCPFFRRIKGGAEVSRGLDASAVPARKKGGGATPCQASAKSGTGSVMMSRLYRCVYCRVLSHAVVSITTNGSNSSRRVREKGWVVLNLTNDAHRLRNTVRATAQRRRLLGDNPVEFDPSSTEVRGFGTSWRGSSVTRPALATPDSRRNGMDSLNGATDGAMLNEEGDEAYYASSKRRS
ncbi:hypothetical protein FOL47_007549 [Perkinsus chesapeaki]|uniref:non-specific serine/threonine protein kinase n=1 Tax=Perkinsus chesapeaki TaxID=330153 RepID=A0A7J6MW80_PERCH|nr:hypothetical protein FOL47_007549 [Perkinsus chesapeaki]